MSQTITQLRFTPTRHTLRDRAARAWLAVRSAYANAATRRQLAGLDDHALSDIGISRAQAQFLAEAPVWDVLR